MTRSILRSRRMALLVASLTALLLLVFAALPALADNGRNYVAHLSGGNELPAPVDTAAQGQAIFHFEEDEHGNAVALEYKLIVANVENVTMAHIHVAPVGQLSGPPAVWLYPAAPPPSLIPGRSDGVLAEGTATAANLVGPVIGGQTLDDLRTAIEQGRAYVNVHTTQYPAGEVRGTIR